MSAVLQKNIGGLAVAVSSIFPAPSAAGTVNGASIDRSLHNMPLSAILHTAVGAATGAPSGISVQSTLQHSPDNVTWSNFLYDGASYAQGGVIASASSEQNYAVDLTLANRFIRVSTTIAFTGGTSPTAYVFAELVLGGEQIVAAV